MTILLAISSAWGEEEGMPPIRLLTYNIRHGEGVDGRLDLARVAKVIAETEPHLVALQEVDQGCTRSGKLNIAQDLGRRLGMEARFGAFMDFQEGEYGLAVLSTFPIQSARRIQLPPGPAEPRCALEVVVTPWKDRPPLSFVSIHNDWLQETARVAQVEALLESMKKVTHPVILAGDFNAPPDSPSLETLRRAGWHVVPKEKGGNTFPSQQPRIEIDYFITRGLEEAAMKSWVLEEEVASDHRPVAAELSSGPE